MSPEHRLLERQLRRHFGDDFDIPDSWRGLIRVVDAAYQQADVDRGMLERALDLSSEELLEANSQVQAVIRAFPDLFFRLDRAGTILDCRGGRPADLLRPAEELIGRKIQELPDIETAMLIRGALEECRDENRIATLQYELSLNGEARLWEARFVPMLDGEILALIRDVTLQAETLKELESSLSLLRATLDSTADGILVVDGEGSIRIFNERFQELWGIPQDILDARDDQRALQHVVDQLVDPEAFLAKVQELYSDTEAESYDEVEFLDGRVFDRYSRPQTFGSGGRVWSFRDVTERKKAEEAIRRHAFRDDLTGLPNRALLYDRLGQAIGSAQRSNRILAVFFMDLDRFKKINDTLGHAMGDRLLQEVGARLEARKRAGDTIARLGGDEFMLVVPDLGRVENAARIAEALLRALRPPVHLDGHTLHITSSIGISLFPYDGVDSEALVKNADVALYRAKESGGDAYQIYESSMNQRALEKLVLENDLRSALENRDFRLHYQPEVDLKTGRVVCVEGLLRWQRGVRTLSEPNDFVPVAEDCGLIVPLGAWVLDSAARQQKRWQEAGLDGLRLAINISPRQFRRAGLLQTVGRALERTQLDPKLLELELTESTIMEEPERGIDTLNALRAMGVSVAIDDFGTGHSSLAYLNRLPIDTLKIDRVFVRQCDRDDKEGLIIRAIVELAHNMGIRVVAEGVERRAQVDFLAAEGCDLVQGFYFSKPVRSEAVPEVIQQVAAQATRERGRRLVARG